MREHFADSDGLGAIFPPMIYTVICLRCLGYADDSPEMHWALKQLEDLMIEEDDTLRLQPCFSPVWDTALALNALADAGLSPRRIPAVERAARWLLDAEVRRPGDWSVTNPGPGAGRLVLRVPQRLLSRHRRHRHGADGPGHARGQREHGRGPAGRRSAACAGCWACRTATAAGRPSTATSTARC